MDPMLTGIPFVDAHGALRPGQLLEVCGVGGSGKTEILMQAAVHAVTPRRRGGVAFNGCEASVLLIDLDGKFDTLRLIKILTGKIRDTVDEASARAYGGTHSADASTSSTFPGFHPGSQTQRRDDVPPVERRYAHPYGHDEGPPPRSDADRAALRDRIYVECMGRFQTIRCHCSLDFLKALAVAERVFQERERKAKEADVTSNSTPPEDSSTYGGVGVKHGDTHARRLLLIDNVAAFYWLDRASRREQGAPLSLRSVHHASAARLQELSRRCRAPIIVTKATTSSAESTSGTSVVNQAQREGMHRAQPGGGGGKPLGQAREHRDFLPQQWTSAVTQRLVLDVERTQGERRTQGGNGNAVSRRPVSRFEGAGGYGKSFVARWELPRGRPGMRYDVGDAGIQCRA